MTGFASVSRDAEGTRVGVTAKSVNHRFLDMAIKAPSSLAAIETRLKNIVQQRLTRGRVEMSISLDMPTTPTYVVTFNDGIVKQVVALIDQARENGLVSGGMTVSDLLRLPQALEVRAETSGPQAVPEATLALIESVVSDAIDALAVMRATEGDFLLKDLDTRLKTLADLVDAIEREARASQQSLEARLRTRIAELPADLAVEPVTVTQEIVRFIARSDIDEEMTRLRGHFQHWDSLVASLEPCGRKLDFLVQEMNREINTIGSKAEGTRVPELVVTAKAELERVKEQVQNVE